MNQELIIYQFSKPAIRVGDYSDFTTRFGRDRLPQGKDLAKLMGTIVPTVLGYDNDPREIYAIPEIRAFYSKLWKAWPYWLFFGNLDTPNFSTMFLCCVSRLDSIHRGPNLPVENQCDPLEVLSLVEEGFPGMNELFDRAGLSAKANMTRTKALIEYIGIPYR